MVRRIRLLASSSHSAYVGIFCEISLSVQRRSSLLHTGPFPSVGKMRSAYLSAVSPSTRMDGQVSTVPPAEFLGVNEGDGVRSLAMGPPGHGWDTRNCITNCAILQYSSSVRLAPAGVFAIKLIAHTRAHTLFV